MMKPETALRLKAHLDRVIEGAMSRERVAGTVVLVSVDGNLAYQKAAGMADREQDRVMREDTIFLLASVTKLITSVAALTLMAEGKLHLDDAVAKWIPRFRPRLADGREPVITLRQLLTHTAGLDYGFDLGRTDYHAANISNGLDMPGLGIEEALERLASVPLLFEPGSRWNYSLSVDVLGEVLARASGRSLPQLIRSQVTGPLGMKDTDFQVHDRSRLATPYVDGMPRPVRMRDPHAVPTRTGSCCFSPSRIDHPESYPSGGAGMVGTAKDVLGLLETIRRGGAPILGAEGAKALHTNALSEQISYSQPGWVFGEPGWTFGLGAAVLYDSTLTRTTHDTGTWQGGGAYGHYWFVNPVRKLSAVILTNTAFEGCEGAYPVDVRDAIYYALSVEE
jgi:CubicO group peptidase (beta-lactamase class C family)